MANCDQLTSLPFKGCCIPRPVATGCVSGVCVWLRDATGLDCGDPSWICNVAQVGSLVHRFLDEIVSYKI